MKKSKKSTANNTNITTYQLPQPCIAKYLVVVVTGDWQVRLTISTH